MIMNLATLNGKNDFCRMMKWVRGCLQMRILGMPHFRCYLSSDLYSSSYTRNKNYLARAHMENSYISRRVSRGKPKHWVIEFNDRHNEAYDVEMVLYHELAHFIAHEIDLHCPGHGLLWAASCDAIQTQMEMDEDSMEEGTFWLSQVQPFEQHATLTLEELESLDDWFFVRKSCQHRIQRAMKKHEDCIHFEDLCAIVARYAFPL